MLKRLLELLKPNKQRQPALQQCSVIRWDCHSLTANVKVLWCIKVQANHDCWIADWSGDPGRTLVKENAKTFINKSDAEKLCSKIKSKYPNRNVWVDVF